MPSVSNPKFKKTTKKQSLHSEFRLKILYYFSSKLYFIPCDKDIAVHWTLCSPPHPIDHQTLTIFIQEAIFKKQNIQINEIHKGKSAICFNSCNISDMYNTLLQLRKPYNSRQQVGKVWFPRVLFKSHYICLILFLKKEKVMSYL